MIGDSQGDIETARQGGARIIAVAAGGTAMADLSDADVALPDLTDASEVERSIRRITCP
ncbi:HAD hydrolase-like protein [Nocardia tengchongensis]|uniref:HAD hydrolase-like protein n=1 Tax=Nocardia tengchongensis TaxID=2055889 RepID=UPI0036CDBF55